MMFSALEILRLSNMLLAWLAFSFTVLVIYGRAKSGAPKEFCGTSAAMLVYSLWVFVFYIYVSGALTFHTFPVDKTLLNSWGNATNTIGILTVVHISLCILLRGRNE